MRFSTAIIIFTASLLGESSALVIPASAGSSVQAREFDVQGNVDALEAREAWGHSSLLRSHHTRDETTGDLDARAPCGRGRGRFSHSSPRALDLEARGRWGGGGRGGMGGGRGGMGGGRGGMGGGGGRRRGGRRSQQGPPAETRALDVDLEARGGRGGGSGGHGGRRH